MKTSLGRSVQILFLALLLFPTAHRADLALDHTFFPPDFITYFEDPTRPVRITQSALTPEGLIYVAAYQPGPFGGSGPTVFLRLLTNGFPDSSFAPVRLTGDVSSIALQPDREIVLGGGFMVVNDTARGGIARVDDHGELDHSFPVGAGIEPLTDRPLVSALAIDSQGNILCGGLFHAVSGQPRESLVRFTPTGQVDPHFQPLAAGFSTSGVEDILLLPDGRIFVAGDVTLANETAKSYLCLLKPDGQRDPSFLAPEFPAPFNVFELQWQRDGKLLARTSEGLFRFLSSGAVDLSFNPDMTTQGGVSILVRPDDRIVIAGRLEAIQGFSSVALAQLFQDGTLDLSFDPFASTSERTTFISALALQPGGKLLVGGDFAVNGQPTPPLFRIEFTPPSTKTLVHFNSLSDFAEDAGTAGINLTRVGDTSYPISVKVVSVDETALHLRDYTAVSQNVLFDAGERNKQLMLSLLDNDLADGTRTFSLYLTNSTGSISPVDADSLRVSIHDEEIRVEIGGTRSVSELSRIFHPFVSVRADPFVYGANPLEFELGFRTTPLTALPGSDYGPVEGSGLFTTAAGVQRFTLEIFDNRSVEGTRSFQVELLPPPPGVLLGEITNITVEIADNDSAHSHGLGANDQIISAAPLPDGKALVGGHFTFFDGLSRRHIARVHPDGSPDESWESTAGLNGAVYTILPQPDGRILLAGEFTAPTPHLARLLPDGSIDPEFDPGSSWSGPTSPAQVWPLALDEDGGIYTGSTFSRFRGEPRPGLARLHPDGTLDTAYQPPIRLASYSAQPLITTLALQPGNRLLVGGDFQLSLLENSPKPVGLVRLLPNGSIDPEFHPALYPVPLFGLTRSNQIIGVVSPSLSTQFVERWDENGLADPSFINWRFCAVLSNLVVLRDDSALITGRICERAYEPFLVLPSDGSAIHTYDVYNSMGRTAVLLADGSLLGSVSSLAAEPPIHRLVRLHPNGAPVNDFRFSEFSFTPKGAPQFRLKGQSSARYRVEISVDLIHWFPVFTNHIPFLPVTFQDLPRQIPAAFYRAVTF